MAVAVSTDRVEKVKSLLRARGLDAIIVAPGSDMAYLIGHFGHPSERPALLVIRPDGPAQIVMAAFEARALPVLDTGVEVSTYTETQDPYEVLAGISAGYLDSIQSAAISDQMWGSVLLRLQQLFARTKFTPASGYLRDLRMRKDGDEVGLMRAAGERADQALEIVLESNLLGQSELDLATALGRAMQDLGLSDTWAIVASGPNGASPHHLSGDRTISTGDAVVLDFGGAFHGYQSDMTRTVFVDHADPEAQEVYQVVRTAQDTGVRMARPGVACQDVDRATRSVISDAGYGEYFIHRTGHGIGLDVHEDPYIVEGNDLQLKPGMIHSVEPGIYLDGRFGVRVEDIVVISENGAERLNHASRELRVVP
jgi:Xaa-Pro aminopeptidase